MNCFQHPDRPAAAYCRTCGRALCAEDQREVYGVVYCQPCLAARMGQPVTPGAGEPAAHSPGLAFVLGLIPGVGAVYNGQYFKAFVQVVIFAFLIFLANSGGDALATFAGLGIAVFYFYMLIDSYRTAKAIAYGQAVTDPFAFDTAGMNAPWGAIVLIAIGVILLLDRLGWFAYAISRFFWPVVLIAAGLYMIQRRRMPARPLPPPVPPPVVVPPPAPDPHEGIGPRL